MSRAKYCIEQASRCRELAAQMSSQMDAKRLREMADAYDAEARSLEGQPVQPEMQQQQQPAKSGRAAKEEVIGGTPRRPAP